MATIFLLTLLIAIPFLASGTSDFKYAGCSQSKYEANSPYKTNVDSLFSSLSNAASTSSFGKFTSTAATSTPVYGVFQCRGDLSKSACQSCVDTANAQLNSVCPLSYGAALQLDGCFVRYANESFIGKEETNLLYKKCGPDPSNGYDANLIGMRDDALQAIVVSGGTGGTYRIGAAGYVQAAAQCVGDLDAKECSNCIATAVGQLKGACVNAVSGELYLGKCFAKYYSDGVYSSPSTTDGYDHDHDHDDDHIYYHHDNEEEAGKTIAIIIGLLAGVALIIVFASFIRRASS